MRTSLRTIFIISGALLLFSLSGCHSNPEKRNSKGFKLPEKKSPGKIVFDQKIHNCGTLKDGEIISYSFIFRNTGGSPVRLVKAEKSCGCVELHFSPDEVAPGKSSAVEFVLNSAGEWGNLIKDATIETSEGEKIALQINAYVENKQFNNLLNTQK